MQPRQDCQRLGPAPDDDFVAAPQTRTQPTPGRIPGGEASVGLVAGRPPAWRRRLAAFVRGLSRAGRRAEVLQAVLDAVSSTRVPERMAENVVRFAQDRIGGDGWAVLSARQAGDLHWLADSGVPQDRRGAMKEAAAQGVRNGRVVWTADGVAIPMKSHGRVVAALVGLDAPRRPSRPRPSRTNGAWRRSSRWPPRSAGPSTPRSAWSARTRCRRSTT